MIIQKSLSTGNFSLLWRCVWICMTFCFIFHFQICSDTLGLFRTFANRFSQHSRTRMGTMAMRRTSLFSTRWQFNAHLWPVSTSERTEWYAVEPLHYSEKKQMKWWMINYAKASNFVMCSPSILTIESHHCRSHGGKWHIKEIDDLFVCLFFFTHSAPFHLIFFHMILQRKDRMVFVCAFTVSLND